MSRTKIPDGVWKKIAEILWEFPVHHSPALRKFIEAVHWKLRTGAPWRDLPAEYGPWSSCFNRFNRWSSQGIWQTIWEVLKDEVDNEKYSVDGSIVKAHQDTYRIKKSQGSFR